MRQRKNYSTKKISKFADEISLSPVIYLLPPISYLFFFPIKRKHSSLQGKNVFVRKQSEQQRLQCSYFHKAFHKYKIYSSDKRFHKTKLDGKNGYSKKIAQQHFNKSDFF